MSLFQKIRTHLQDDPLLRRVVRNSSYLFSSSAVSAVMSVVQMIIVVRLLDVDEYGLATGTIMVFATSVNQLLSFRMSEVVVKYAGDALAHDRKDRAAALITGIFSTRRGCNLMLMSTSLGRVSVYPGVNSTSSKVSASASRRPVASGSTATAAADREPTSDQRAAGRDDLLTDHLDGQRADGPCHATAAAPRLTALQQPPQAPR